MTNKSGFVRDSDVKERNYLTKIEAIISDILPSVAKVWSEALYVIPVVGNMFVSSRIGANGRKCGEADIPEFYSTHGVPDTDTLILVTTDGPLCHDGQRGISSYATVCSFDQHHRPVLGNLVICLDDIEVNDGVVSDEEILRQISSQTLEVGKILGLSPSLFQYYRNPATGRAWGSSLKTVTCVDGTKDTLDVPNILAQGFDGDDSYFEVVTPTVKQVVRNHFDCQTLRGARLENLPTSFSCFGESFDERFHFDDDMTSIGGTADMAYSLSPLTLALLEDSSWYKGDFSKSTTPLFGRGAGCGFVKGHCIVDGQVPDYGAGFFCEGSNAFGCDYTHTHKALCDISKNATQSLEPAHYDISWLSDEDMQRCPMRTKRLVMCSDEINIPSFPWESYGPNSRCFETTDSEAFCIESYCNTKNSRIDLIVGREVLQCDYDGQVLSAYGHQIKCPRFAVVCPDLVCPANCSGKGMCDYCLEEPKCICDDPFDESPGCWG